MKAKSFFISQFFALVSVFSFGQNSFEFTDTPFEIKGHKFTVNEVIFSPDGSRLYSCGGNNQIIVFDPVSGDSLKSTPVFEKPVHDIALSSDGKLLAYSGYNLGVVHIADARTLTDIARIEDFEYVEDLCFVPGQYVLAVVGWRSSTQKQVIETFSAENGTFIKQYFTQGVEKGYPSTVDISHDGKYLACGLSGNDKGLRIWDFASGKLLKSISHGDEITVVTFSPDGKTLAGGSIDKNVYCWDVVTGTLRNTFTGLNDFVTTIDISPDGKHLVAAGMDHSCTFKMWNTENGNPEQTVGQSGPDIESLCFSPGGNSLAVAYRTYGDVFTYATICIYKTKNAVMSEKWFTVNSEKAKMQIDFPARVEEKVSGDQYYDYYDYNLTYSRNVYQIRATHYKFPVDDQKRKETIEKKLNDYNEGTTKADPNTLQVFGGVGSEIVVYKNDARYHYRFIFIGDISYHIVFATTNMNEIPEEMRFLDSFVAK